MEEYRRWGGRWASVAAQLGRSGLGCRNRWRLLERKKANGSTKPSGSSTSPSPGTDHSLPASESTPTTNLAPPSPSLPEPETMQWSNDLLDQFQNELSGNNSLLFANSMDQLGTTIPLDQHLFDFNPFDHQLPAQFDARLWDIMQGGCGCGCGTGRGCGCSDDASPPFMDIASQSFLQPYHHMSQAFTHLDPPPSYAVSQPMPLLHQPLQFSDQIQAPTPYIPPQREVTNNFIMQTSNQPTMISIASAPIIPDVTSIQNTPIPFLPTLSPTFDGSHQPQPSSHHDQLPTELSISLSTPSTVRNTPQTPLLPPPQQAEPIKAETGDVKAPTSCCKPPDQLTPPNKSTIIAAVMARSTSACRCSGSCCGPNKAGPSSEKPFTGGCCRPLTSVLGIKRPSASEPPIVSSTKKVKSTKDSPPSRPRLSSNLAATTNTQALPYACGDPKCWVSDNDIRARFNTSGELLDHYRTTHDDGIDGGNNKIFRCALEGCGKGWKVGHVFLSSLCSSPLSYPYLEHKRYPVSSSTLQVPFRGSNQSACVAIYCNVHAVLRQRWRNATILL